MSDKITYYVDINCSETPYGRCTLAELQTIELTPEQYDIDDEDLYDYFTNWDIAEGREALEEGCKGWGPFTDQNAIVSTEDDTVVAVIDIEDAITDEFVHDTEHHLPYDTKGKHAIGVSIEKGGFRGEFELPADEKFDPELLTFGIVCLADGWTIVNTVQYKGEDVYMEGDSTGKCYDIYTFENDEVTHIG